MKISSISHLDQFAEIAKPFRYVSFDLFDTLVFRSGLQRDEILVMSCEYITGLAYSACGVTVDAEQVQRLREKFTELLKRSNHESTEEPLLSRVLSRILVTLGVSVDDVSTLTNQALEYELELEQCSLDLSPGAIELLSQLRSMGKNVVIVSDMYFSRQEISRILDTKGLSEYVDALFVSSELGKTKSSGNLFPLIVNDLQITSSEMIHLGDNFRSDVVLAKQSGIEAVYKKTKNSHQVKRSSGECWEDLLANLVVSFNCMLAKACQKNGIRRLYFLSRDATVFYEVFDLLRSSDSIFNKLTESIEIRHLCVSRASMLYLNLQKGECPLSEVMGLYLGLHRSGFELAELLSFLDIDADIGGISTTFIRSKKDVSRAASQIISLQSDLGGLIVQKAQMHARDAHDYLKQEQVIGAGETVGLVDIGYSGSIPRNIVNYVCRELPLCEMQSVKLVVMLMCGGNGFIQEGSNAFPQIYFESPLIPERKLTYLQRLNFSWFEVFFQDTNRGALHRYSRSEDEIQPKFSPFNGASSLKEGWIRVVQEKVNSNHSTVQFFGLSEQGLVVERFLALMAQPSSELVKRIRVADFVRGSRNSEGYSIIDTQDIGWRLLWPVKLKQVSDQEVWIEGSLAASGKSWMRYPLIFIAAPPLYIKKCLRKMGDLSELVAKIKLNIQKLYVSIS